MPEYTKEFFIKDAGVDIYYHVEFDVINIEKHQFTESIDSYSQAVVHYTFEIKLVKITTTDDSEIDIEIKESEIPEAHLKQIKSEIDQHVDDNIEEYY